jgi:accessory colonization factor AcfC
VSSRGNCRNHALKSLEIIAELMEAAINPKAIQMIEDTIREDDRIFTAAAAGATIACVTCVAITKNRKTIKEKLKNMKGNIKNFTNKMKAGVRAAASDVTLHIRRHAAVVPQ